MLPHGSTRRALLTGVGSIALSGCLGRTPSPPPPASPEEARAIDVHCHFFNARDIPISKFIRDVVLREEPPLGAALDPVIKVAQAVLELGAISATDEAASLRGRLRLNTLQANQELPNILGDDDLIQDRVQRAVARMQGPVLLDLRLGGQTTTRMTPDVEEFLKGLIAQTGANARADTQPSGAAPLSARGVSPAAAGLALRSVGDEIKGIVRLASLLTLRRSDLSDRLYALPKTGGGEVMFFAPAMVDYGWWLGAERETTPLAEQVDVMAAVSARKGKPYAVHSYVSYCPWRQMMEPGQFETVVDAVMNKGCVGIKVYPVMGFLPYGNADATDKDKYPPRLTQTGPDWAKRLDAAMAKLFDFCVKEDIPILTHCALSQDTSDAAGTRASPNAWEVALRRWPTLRLNLGHFGGIWDLSNPGHDAWVPAAVRLMAQYPNIYADVADHSIVTGTTAKDRANEGVVAANLHRILAAHDPTRIARRKLMYGTDWSLLSRAPGLPDYYPKMKADFPADAGLTPSETPGFLGASAARFLGLVPTGGVTPKSRGRLEAFYKVHGLDPAVLATWDAVG